MLPYAIPTGEQGVGAERAERNLKIELGDKKICSESERVEKHESKQAFLKRSFLIKQIMVL